jgi:DNA repair protein RecO (recombination protein O)
MPLLSTQAFVLDYTPINEQDKLVHLLSLESGILKAVAPGALKSKNRFGSMLEMFTLANFFYYQKDEKEMVTLSKGDILTSFFNTVSRPENIFTFYLMAEILLKIIPANQRDKRIFRLVHSLLKAGQSGRDMETLLLYFQVWILKIEGLMFNPGICYNCFRKNIKNAWLKTDFRGILCSRCRGNESFHLSEPELGYIDWMASNPPDSTYPYSADIRIRKMNRIFLKKIEYHAECSFKSKQYLPGFF